MYWKINTKYILSLISDFWLYLQQTKEKFILVLISKKGETFYNSFGKNAQYTYYIQQKRAT